MVVITLRRRGNRFNGHVCAPAKVVLQVQMILILLVPEEQKRLNVIAPKLQGLKGRNGLRDSPELRVANENGGRP